MKTNSRHLQPFSTLGLSALALAAGLSACATTSPGDRMAKRLALFEEVAQAPVKSFHFWQMHRWEALGRSHVAVWTRLDTAYLIEVDQPCSGLDFTSAIALSSTQNRVHSRFDDVRFEDQRCRIAEIRPVDVAALKKAEHAARDSD
ncbi:DUF6491 family protein [Pseudomarimonas arenosa]|uniref:Lipoprotein n=1 Tax=Pseudomarimonas arenosa TaxID=2774145 RepID=A0AAW3ZK70_9GAMM|nr:DUF6491 family protein [Pseudomarimonas arenosa]MBD8526485.1 hypothetical protein [Pseudomarimonas arenosa]